MAKRKCVFRQEFIDEFPGMKPSTKGSTFIHCTMCNTDLNLSYGGISAIGHHVNSAKHVSLECNKCTTQSLALFIPKEQITLLVKLLLQKQHLPITP